MRTFLANLKHAAHGTQYTTIGGGSFSPAECQVVVETIEDLTEALEGMVKTFGNSTVLSDYGRDKVKVARDAILRARAD